VEQELLTLPAQHLRSRSVVSGVRVARSLVLCVMFVDHCLTFFLLAIVLSVLLRSLITSLVSSNFSYQINR